MRQCMTRFLMFIALNAMFLMWLNHSYGVEWYESAEQELVTTYPLYPAPIDVTLPKRQVLITTLPRSGSTFLGEFFRHDPRLVYLFEVTRGYSEAFHYDKCSSSIDNLTASRLTKDIFSCDFRELQKFMVNEDPAKVFYTWQHAFNYSSPPDQLSRCLPPDIESNAEKSLRLNTSVIIKEITFWAPKTNWLLEQFGEDFRILWLVRDVRGFVSSWMNWNNASVGLYEEFGYHRLNFWKRYADCIPLKAGLFEYEHQEHLRELLSNAASPVHKRMAAYWTVETALSLFYFQQVPKHQIMVVHYEHLANNPLEYVQHIYKFLGFGIVPRNVLDWIFESTQYGNENARFDTKRAAKKMTQVHKQRMTLQQIKEVEEIAKPLFPYFNVDSCCNET